MVYKWFANIFATPELFADVFAGVAQLDRATAKNNQSEAILIR